MKIYKIYLDSDLGELWLNNEKQPIAYIHADDGHFDSSWYGFVIEELGGELVTLYANELLSDDEYGKLYECDCADSFYEVLKDKL
jgi:hypothetical protein